MQRYLFPVVLCATLGLAPFAEPHLLGKLRWVAGGAVGMSLIDWGDLLMHGAPFLWLFGLILRDLFGKPRHRLTGEQAKELVDGGAVLLDVRSQAEFASGHLNNAVNIPVGELTKRIGELPSDRAIVLCCASGMRSGRATSMLQRAGREDVYDLGSQRNWPR
jgi:rhodanese-related sulfurtransferase